jgi:hypothetical protein
VGEVEPVPQAHEEGAVDEAVDVGRSPVGEDDRVQVLAFGLVLELEDASGIGGVDVVGNEDSPVSGCVHPGPVSGGPEHGSADVDGNNRLLGTRHGEHSVRLYDCVGVLSSDKVVIL